MDVAGSTVLVLGGAGLVGRAVGRELLALGPATLVIAARRRSRAQQVADELAAAATGTSTRIVPVWGDVFIRAEWQTEATHPRAAVLADGDRRRRLIADILDPLDADIVESALLTQVIDGRAAGAGFAPAEIVVDCMNTATGISYRDVYAQAQRLAALAGSDADQTDWPEAVETLLASLYVPQLVRHVQLLYEAMRRAGTRAYIKVGTTGLGGMGFNIPYTHGEEKPSRLLLAKAAVAGAQSLLTFLLARTPGGPALVREIKPAAAIGWREIGYGPVRRRGSDIPVFDCLPDQAVSIRDRASLAVDGGFGKPTGEVLHGVYIDTGENGLFSAAEFTAITALGQMELVTPEEIARLAVRELTGGTSGRDVVAALDGAVMPPSYRAGVLRQAAISRLHQLEAEHDESVAFEILGPPRLSKLLFEAYLLKRVCGSLTGILEPDAEALSGDLAEYVERQPPIRRRMISVGIPVLLPDGERLLRGPRIKSEDAHHGWVDLTPANIRTWQRRAGAIRELLRMAVGDSSSSLDRNFAASRAWVSTDDAFDIGEVAAWILEHEEKGRRATD